MKESLVDAAALLLSWEGLDTCGSEDQLRAALVGAFYRVEADAGRAGVHRMWRSEAPPPKGFDSRIDLVLTPVWPPDERWHAAGELKLLRRGTKNSRVGPLGARLSDVHFVHSLVKLEGIYGFFLDIVFQVGTVGQDGYDALTTMCVAAREHRLSGRLMSDDMRELPGLAAFSREAKDRTPRKARRNLMPGSLFPPLDLGDGSFKPGPTHVLKPQKNRDGLIGIAVRYSGGQQSVPYRLLSTRAGTPVACCFAVFEPGGELGATTDELRARLRPSQASITRP